MKNYLLAVFVFTLISCENKSNEIKIPENHSEETDKVYRDNLNGQIEETQNANYKKTRETVEEFVPEGFEIQHQAEGNLNQDGLSDAVIVLKLPSSKREIRPVLVLLREKDNTYRLDKFSDAVMPFEFAENDFQQYDSESISIKNGELQIDLFGIGPVGNLFSHYQYDGNDFVLISIETYDMGAGSHQGLFYDLKKGELKQEIINTMKEEMPSEIKKFQLPKEKYLFENSSPDDII